MEEASRRRKCGRHQCCYWERINILSESMKCNQLPRNTSRLLYPESCQHENWTSFIRKSVHVLRLPPKISLKHEWERELGSEHAQRSEAGQMTRSLQFNQPTLNPKIRCQGWRDNCKMEEKRPVLGRSMSILFTKNLVLLSERFYPLRENPFMTRV